MLTRIFSKDYALARVLPVAIVSASEVLNGSDYTTQVEHFLDVMLANTSYDDWAIRYFAAQTYIDLHSRTLNDRYLQQAYEIALSNVTVLVRVQEEMNSTYLAEVQMASATKGATKKQEEEIKKYNTQLKEERKTALAPISNPLL